MASIFLETLRQAELDAYYSSLTAYGVRSVESLMQLTMQDYGGVGVHSMEDRKRLFQLIQTLKSDNDTSKRIQNLTNRSLTELDSKPSTSSSAQSRQSNPSAVSVPVNPTQRQYTRSSNEFNNRVNDFNDSKPSTSNNSDFDQNFGQSNRSYQKHSRSQNDLDDQTHFRKIAKQTASPKQRSLNAYGVPEKITKKQGDLTDRIRVCVRKRPLNRKELKRNETDITPVTGRRTLVMLEPKTKVDLTKYIEKHEFCFDEAFDADATNEQVYKRTALPLVNYIFEGGKATCFAYGQTGSGLINTKLGKTFTMLDSENGLYVLAGRDIFGLLKKVENSHLSAWISFYEIYQGQLYDLLGNRKRLYAREDGKQQVVIQGIQEYEVDCVEQLLQVFESGNGTRSTGATGANADSSRSHAIFQIVLKHRTKGGLIHGKLSFIDLAGSERGADRGETDKQTRMEGSEINKSLLALKECIRALDQVTRHTPFRQSKLTQVLKDSFIGNSRTCMIATITPSSSNSEHSLNTLRYADRVKELKGDTNDEHEEDDFDATHDEIEYEDENNMLLDEEFPPEIYTDSVTEDIQMTPAKNKSSILSQVNKRQTPSRLAPFHESKSLEMNQSETTLDFKQNSKEDVDMELNGALRKTDMIEDITKLHRIHIRDCSDFGKQESKLLVNVTMKLGKGGDLDKDGYLKELDELLKAKIESAEEIRAMIKAHFE